MANKIHSRGMDSFVADGWTICNKYLSPNIMLRSEEFQVTRHSTDELLSNSFGAAWPSLTETPSETLTASQENSSIPADQKMGAEWKPLRKQKTTEVHREDKDKYLLYFDGTKTLPIPESTLKKKRILSFTSEEVKSKKANLSQAPKNKSFWYRGQVLLSDELRDLEHPALKRGRSGDVNPQAK